MSEPQPNPWCRVLGIETPTLEAIANHPEANHYTRLLVALLERGEPMTLEQVAERIEAAGIAERSRALQSLKRCRPGRPPVYREGDHYTLDPHDDELDLWVFTLGLRPPKVRTPAPPPELEPLPGPETPLTTDELDEAFRNRSLSQWSAQRLALAILDAHGEPLPAIDVVQWLDARTRYHRLKVDSARTSLRRKGSPVSVREDGRWAIAADTEEPLEAMRTAVRALVETARRQPPRTSPEELEQLRERWDAKRRAHQVELTAMSRALIVAFPETKPEAAALLDVETKALRTFIGAELGDLPARLEPYDIIGAVSVRPLLRSLGIELGDRRVAELGPPQKTRQLNRRGRTLTLTTELLIQGSCNISRPFGDPNTMAGYLRDGKHGRLRRRLEADLKSLYAMYQYGRLHGMLRLRWGFLDEGLRVPWVHADEETLFDLTHRALDSGRPLEVVAGTAPGWADPWARKQRVSVQSDPEGRRPWLVDEHGRVIEEADVQLARLVE
ncbi:MAG: hypothetical protein JJ863_38445 [Deltaproteobacteria bacterium]|nr:hypothetical protein [Deltaproteobacteria bacterium]